MYVKVFVRYESLNLLERLKLDVIKMKIELEVGLFVEGIGWNSRIVSFDGVGQDWKSAEGDVSIKLVKVRV